MKQRIDPHAHPRPDIYSVARLAKDQQISTVLFMPRDNKEILKERDLAEKLAYLQKRKPAVKCFFYARLTSNSHQIEEAVRLAKNYPEVAGLKLYLPENENKTIYRILAQENYTGVLAVHAEKASLFKPELFDPRKPWTHNLAQPPEAEIASIKDQILFAEEVNFRGTLYICHISLPESAQLIWQAKKHLNIYSEVTPHHLLLSDLQMHSESGLLLKVNPPLRSCEAVRGLLASVKRERVDCLGTDYAYHPLGRKIFPPYNSGIAFYPFYGIVLKYLKSQGVTDSTIENMTYWNIKNIFGEKLKSR